MPVSKLKYFDYAAATPMSDTVRKAMEPYLQRLFFNPSATYLAARGVKDDLGRARQTVAGLLGARSSEITFTAGGTEANNLAIHGLLGQYPDANVVTSAIEHESVLEPAAQYAHKAVPVNAKGVVEVDTLRSLIGDHTVLVSVMYANNEIGTVQPIRDIAYMVADERKRRRHAGNTLPLYLHADAAQAGNYLDLHVARLGIDLMTLNGGKLYGPKQSGVLYTRAGVVLQPLIRGGGQEHGVRSGTENVAACIGFAGALEEAQALRHAEVTRLSALQKLFVSELKAKLPTVSTNGSLTRRLPNNVHITVPGYDNERLLLQLEQVGILAAAGSACSASSEKPSHVLAALGLSESETRSSVRFTMGRQTTEADVRAVISALVSLIA